MSHYCYTGDVDKLVPLNRIILTPQITNEIKKYLQGRKNLKRERPKLKRSNILGLFKLKNMIKQFHNQRCLPPVLVKIRHIRGRDSRDSRDSRNRDSNIYYEIIDGRHRVSASYLFGYDLVPVKFFGGRRFSRKRKKTKRIKKLRKPKKKSKRSKRRSKKSKRKHVKTLPNLRSNPITNNSRILIGACPRDSKDVEKMIKYGITMIVDLQEKSKQYPYDVDIKSEGTKIIKLPIPNGKAPAMKKAKEVVDQIIDEYNNGGKIYIHCRGGHGRAGTIGAYILGTMHDYNCVEAIEAIERFREKRPDKSRNFIPTPETNVQVKFLCKVLGIPNGVKPPDRSDKSWLQRVKKEKRKRIKRIKG